MEHCAATPEGIVSNMAMFRDVLRRVEKVKSVCELGAGYGLNMIALHTLIPSANLTAVEINHKGAEMLIQLGYVNVIESSIYQAHLENKFDLVLTKGVAMHQEESILGDFYEILYGLSKRYIILCEYYNPTPMEIPHRVRGKIYKRDFAGELMDRYSDLKLVDYGFQYHRDNLFPVDDFTWFVLEKQ